MIIQHWIIIITTIMLLLLCGCKQHDFPNRENIDNFFLNYESEKNLDKRILLTTEFLSRMRDSQKAEDDYNIQYFIAKLTNTYKKNNDESILIAIDNTRIQGSFANYICGFYKAVKMENSFKKRYFSGNNDLKKSVERCVGISFSYDEIMQEAGR